MKLDLLSEQAAETRLHVGIGECAVSDTPGAVLITHALGSCIAVVLHDPLTCVTGLLHYMLPDSTQTDEATRRVRPYVYADSGIPLFFKSAYAQGASKQRLIVALVGGAQILSPNDTFQIGRRNYLAARKLLWRAGVLIRAEDVGGLLPRNVKVHVSSGRILVSRAQSEHVLLPSLMNGVAHAP